VATSMSELGRFEHANTHMYVCWVGLCCVVLWWVVLCCVVLIQESFLARSLQHTVTVAISLDTFLANLVMVPQCISVRLSTTMESVGSCNSKVLDKHHTLVLLMAERCFDPAFANSYVLRYNVHSLRLSLYGARACVCIVCCLTLYKLARQTRSVGNVCFGYSNNTSRYHCDIGLASCSRCFLHRQSNSRTLHHHHAHRSIVLAIRVVRNLQSH
jgi:ABC-type Fe3+ transport system permease subunit